MASLTVENYVKSIYAIAAKRRGKSAVSTGEISQALGVLPGTVTAMLKTLSEAELVTYTPYEGVRLTRSGQRMALMVLRRHRLLELFLVRTLQMSWDEVHEEAENMEHAVSERLIERIDELFGHPAVDPHGDPIPTADGAVHEPAGEPLSQLKPGQSFCVVRVIDQNASFLRYLTECGLDLGTVGEVTESRPEAGVIMVRVADRTLPLGFGASTKILVVPTAL